MKFFLGLPVSWGVGLVVVGCSSSTPEPAGSGAIASAEAPTYHRDIEPIVQKRCQGCHHDAGIAPFSLTSYASVQGRAHSALKAIVEKRMPPWGVYDDDDCKVTRPLQDDLRLSPDEVSLFDRWVQAGSPEGDAREAPPAMTFSPDRLERATHNFALPKPYTLPAGGQDQIRCFPVNPGFEADTWIDGSNVLPGNRKVVHHVIVYADPQGQGASKVDATGSYPCFGGPGVSSPSLVLAWAPGVRPASYGDQSGLKLAKGTQLILQVHYHPAETEETDATSFELRTLPAKPAYVTQLMLLGNAASANGLIRLLPGLDDPPTGPAFVIPADRAAHVESMELTIPKTLNGIPVPALKILSVGTHMHWAGVDMRVEIERASESPQTECLLGTPNYDFNWQRAYTYQGRYDDLPTMNAGDKLKFTCTYNNTMNNPFVRKALGELRMASPVSIQLGETTLDEMCLGAMMFVRRATILD